MPYSDYDTDTRARLAGASLVTTAITDLHACRLYLKIIMIVAVVLAVLALAAALWVGIEITSLTSAVTAPPA
jgi:hypothetical protein